MYSKDYQQISFQASVTQNIFLVTVSTDNKYNFCTINIFKIHVVGCILCNTVYTLHLGDTLKFMPKLFCPDIKMPFILTEDLKLWYLLQSYCNLHAWEGKVPF